MVTELVAGELIELAVDAAIMVIKKQKSNQEWKQVFINSGRMFIENEAEADRIFDDLADALSSENMAAFAAELKSENGYDLKEKLSGYILRLLRKYDIPNDIALSYTIGLTDTILSQIEIAAPEKYDRYFQKDWREENKTYLTSLSSKIEKIGNELLEYNEKQIKVYSANDKDLELKRKTINPRIGIDFFEIDDEDFQSVFSEQLNNTKICVRGRFVEETIYCVLNELWRVRDPRAVFVVQSEEDWERLRKLSQTGNVFIPDFYADEITPIENNTNIFIFTEDIPAFSNNIIDLRPRTFDTLTRCLIRAGMDAGQANALVAETHGLYTALKKKIFNGQLRKMPAWMAGLDDNIKKTCLLLGQWTECEGDQAVVENLSGLSYTDFIRRVTPYTRGEDPLLHEIKRRGNTTYYLASVENTWEYLYVSVDEEIWKVFSDLFLAVINEYEQLLTYDSKELLFARYNGERLFWSAVLRKGLLRTLLIKAGYKKQEECQDQLDQLIKKVFSFVDNPDKWKYISEFFIELCEISPGVILDRLNKELIESTGLLSLFENQNPGFIMGKNYYINILFGVEEFLLQREYAADALIWLCQLNDKGLMYQSNCPSDIISKALCVWHNFSAFQTAEEKIVMAAKIFRYDRNAWELIYKALPGKQQAVMGTIHSPKYREHIHNKDVLSYAEFNNNAVGYLELLLKHVDFKSERWVKLFEYSDHVDGSIRKKIFRTFLYESTQMSDEEKIEVKNAIRKIIYKHRYFSSSSWALPEQNIIDYEQLLNDIRSSIPEYEYVYLFSPGFGLPLLHPVPYDKEGKREVNEELKKNLIADRIREFREKGLDLSLLAGLCADIENTTLGHALARNWNDRDFDMNVFSILLKAQRSGVMAVQYYCGFGDQVPGLFDEVLSAARSFSVSEEIITSLYTAEASFTKQVPKVTDAPESVKTLFWEREFVSIAQDVDWALGECRKYGTLSSFIHFLYFTYQRHPISNEELFSYFDGIENMKRKETGSDISYYLKDLLKPLQEAYINDNGKCVRLATIELMFFRLLEWENMKCFRYSVAHEPKVYADLISIIFKKDHEVEINSVEKDQDLISNLYDLYYQAEFCPAESGGDVDGAELERWIGEFRILLEKNDQSSLFGMILGRLFAFSPVGEDDHKPCEAVREMIEKYSDDSLRREYSLTLFNSRGVFSPSAGKEERRIAENFKSNAEYLISLGYPKTAEIYYGLYRRYMEESEAGREDAENGRFF